MSRTPLVIYVLWHPKASDGAALASEIYGWFHMWSDDLLRSGMGVPVFFRSQSRDATTPLPPPIALDEADSNVIVVLADAEMVADPEWTRYLEEIDSGGDNTCLVPVALHSSAYRLPEALRKLNFLRIDERDDPPVDAVALRARRIPRLLRQLTEVIGRRLSAQLTASGSGGGDRSAPPLTIFLSHAKRDGVDVAEAVRSTIQNNGRLRAFFDDSDLPVGQAFAAELNNAAVNGTAAMIVIVSDAYAARPWCRKEIALARKPRRDPAAARCWWIQPVLVVDALRGAPTRNIPELGNATLVRWSPEGALETVDLLMLEVLLASYHRLRARAIEAREGRHVVSWTPDVHTLLGLQREAGEPITEVIYPGHPLPKTERMALWEHFPAITLRTFEETQRPLDPTARIAERVVGLSVAFNEDLGSLGLGKEHLEEVTLRIARCIVDSGGRLAYGGMLNSNELTGTLLTLVRALTADEDEAPAARLPLVISYQRWPSLPSAERIASDVGVSEYVLVDNPVPPQERVLDSNRRVASPARARELALTLTAMRTAMTTGGRTTTTGRAAPALDARVVVGGAKVDFNGYIPGVLEEVMYALEAGKAVYVLGGFGGAADILARAILGEDPAELTAAYHREKSMRFRRLEAGLEARGEGHIIERRFDDLRSVIDRVRQGFPASLGNGLDEHENRRLMKSDHLWEVVWLLRRGLGRLGPRP